MKPDCKLTPTLTLTLALTPTLALALLLTLLAGVSAAVAQTAAETTVDTVDGQVVVDGDYVRIDSADESVDVDWRRGGVHVQDGDDDVLVELGAVRAADHILVPLAGDILFEFGSAVLDAAAERALGRLAHAIRRHAVGEVLVVGHTDSIGDAVANQRLSEQRALSVIRWLHRHEGIPASVLVARGMGERQPLAPNTRGGVDDPAGRAKNRRVEVVLGTTENADVRAIAHGVTVRGDRVEVAGVEVDGESGRVRVAGLGGLDGAGGSGTSGRQTCAAGKTCRADCPDGECSMACSAGAICDYGCSGGNCVMECASGATCEFSCDGGDCRFEKGFASRLTTSCEGGGCRS